MGCNCGNKTKVTSGVPTVNGLPDMCACGKPKNECCCNKPKNPCCDEPKPCKQSHDVTLVQSVYTTTVEATNSWAMPAVDDCVQLHLKDVVNILPGAILWNQSVGQLKVSSYDSTTGYVLACNNGDSGNAEEGTAFPSCMSFHVGIPVECNCDDDYAGVCLAADMTSPGEGETTEVSVTTVSGLFIGDVIDIAGYMYRITAINDVSTITVKNEGYGAPIGTVIKNDPNCTGKKCTVKITVVNSDDPCTKDPVQEGVLVVCDDGEKTTLQGTADSQIAVWDNNDKKWKLKTVKIEDECTNLTVDLTLDPLVNLYIINVLTTAIFQVNDIVYLGGHKFKVNSIVNSTQMRIELLDAISSIIVIEEGEAICLGDCCEKIVLPEKYSDVITTPNSIKSYYRQSVADSPAYNFPDMSNSAQTTIQKEHTFSNTISLPAPLASGTITLIGTATIQYEAVGRADTHYHATYHAINYIVPPRVCLSGNVSVTNNGVTTKMYQPHSVHFYNSGIAASNADTSYITESVDGLYVYNAFYCTGNFDEGFHKWSDTDPGQDPLPAQIQSKVPVSQNITIPISITVDASYATSITVSGKIKLMNARGELTETDDHNKTNEDVAIVLKEVVVATSLAWILQ